MGYTVIYGIGTGTGFQLPTIAAQILLDLSPLAQRRPHLDSSEDVLFSYQRANMLFW